MIRGFVGRPGAGKTYCMTAMASKHLMRGRDVFANFHLRGAYYFTPDQLLDLPPGLILIDEAHMIFNARNSIRLPPSLLMKMSQTRKSGWELWWSAQHEQRVDKVVQHVSNLITVCTAWLPDAHGTPRWFHLVDYEPEYCRQAKGKLTGRWMRFNPEIAALYDTYEGISVAAHNRSKTDIYDTEVAS